MLDKKGDHLPQALKDIDVWHTNSVSPEVVTLLKERHLIHIYNLLLLDFRSTWKPSFLPKDKNSGRFSTNGRTDPPQKYALLR